MKRLIAVAVMAAGLAGMVVGQALAFDPTGSYTFKEKGMAGSMDVKEVGTSISVQINTSSKDARICDIEANGSRIISSDKSIDASFNSSNSDAKFDVVFTPKGAMIKTTSDSNGCGMNAYFDGKWAKGTKKGKK